MTNPTYVDYGDLIGKRVLFLCPVNCYRGKVVGISSLGVRLEEAAVLVGAAGNAIISEKQTLQVPDLYVSLVEIESVVVYP